MMYDRLRLQGLLYDIRIHYSGLQYISYFFFIVDYGYPKLVYSSLALFGQVKKYCLAFTQTSTTFRNGTLYFQLSDYTLTTISELQRL